MRSFRIALAALLPLALVVVVAFVLVRQAGAKPSEAFYQPESRSNSVWYNGVAIPALDDLATWDKATGEHPGVVQIYVPLGIDFPYGEVQAIERSGALPIIQIDYKKPVSDIVSGQYDNILKKWGEDIAKMREPVALSFGHEMNGNWFSWGCTHTTPATFIAAWQRMHRLMGSPKTLWIYTINRTDAGFSCGPMEYYPGNAYVNLIGIDGYFRQPSQSYNFVFGPTISDISAATSKPILLTEVGVPKSGSQVKQIKELFQGAYQDQRVIGIDYFDQDKARGDYRLQDNPAALAVFREEIAKYGNHRTMR